MKKRVKVVVQISSATKNRFVILRTINTFGYGSLCAANALALLGEKSTMIAL